MLSNPMSVNAPMTLEIMRRSTKRKRKKHRHTNSRKPRTLRQVWDEWQKKLLGWIWGGQ